MSEINGTVVAIADGGKFIITVKEGSKLYFIFSNQTSQAPKYLESDIHLRARPAYHEGQADRLMFFGPSPGRLSQIGGHKRGIKRGVAIFWV